MATVRSILLFGLLFWCSFLNAADLCVKATSSGAANGTDWDNALGASWTPVRGNRYYVADGSFGNKTWSTALSGTTSIIIKKATIAEHGPAAGWSDAYAAQATFSYFIFATSFWELDGVTGGGPGSWTNGFGFRASSGGNPIQLDDGVEGAITVSNITIRHLEVQGGGRHTDNGAELIFRAIYAPKNVTISYCWWHDVATVILSTRNSRNFLLEYSKFSANGPATNAEIHKEFWSASTDSDVVIRHCWIEDISNSAIIAIFNGTGRADNWVIYGNLFSRTPGDATVENAVFLDAAYMQAPENTNTMISISGWRFFNNTIVGLSGPSSPSFNVGANMATTNNYFYNNLIHSNACNAVYAFYFTTDYNWYGGNWRAGVGELDTSGASGQVNAQIGSGTPFVNWTTGNFNLVAPTSSGTNTATFGSGNSTDMVGNTRGSHGVWDMGALEWVPASGTTINVHGTLRVGTIVIVP